MYYVYLKRWKIGRLSIDYSRRGTEGMGRFGGGWNWNLGFQIGGTTVIINLLVASIRIELSERKVNKHE